MHMLHLVEKLVISLVNIVNGVQISNFPEWNSFNLFLVHMLTGWRQQVKQSLNKGVKLGWNLGGEY